MKQLIVDNQATNYYITEEGACFNAKTGNWLKGQISNSGYLNYNLSLPNEKRRMYAHRLVALTYLYETYEKDKEVNHKDGNKLNNKVDNLEWVTKSENLKHNTVLENTKVATIVFQYDKDKKLVNRFSSITEASEQTKTSQSLILQEIHKEVKALTHGYYWNDKEENTFETIFYPNLGKSKRVRQYDLNGEIICEYASAGEAARALNLSSHSHISECCRGKIKTYKGYKWEYIDC